MAIEPEGATGALDEHGSRPVTLETAEERQVERRTAVRPHVVHEAIREEGETELRRPARALFWSGLAAGLSMGFSLVAQGLLRVALPDAAWRPLVVSAGYGVGFLIVVLGANVLGTIAFAWVIGHTEVLRPEARAAITAISRGAIEANFGTTLLRGLFAGWLIALMVWLLPAADTARVAIIVIITYVIGMAGLAHVVVGSVEAAYLVLTGDASWFDYAGRFFVPTLLGNVIGGVALVAALNHAQVIAGE